MWLFIRRIRYTTTRKQLERFIARGLQHHWLFIPLPSKAHIKRCEILQITNGQGHEAEFHGLVDIEPASAAQAAIEKLDGKELKGKAVQIRKFFRRSYLRDRRQGFGRRNGQQNEERRQQDRRRPNIRCCVIHAPHIERILGICQS